MNAASHVAGDQLRRRLEAYRDPWLGVTLGEARAVRAVAIEGGRTRVEIVLGFPAADYAAPLAADLRAWAGVGDGDDFAVTVRTEIIAHAVQKNLKPLAGINNIVAVASGKGGVGKSTVAANLALAWARQGARTGLLDADIYGPSQPIMMGLTGQRPVTRDQKRIEPLQAYGVAVMSIGFLIDPDQPMVWRGPMVTQALTQLLGDTDWGELDYLVVDMPPGTGDIQLTLAQKVPVSGVVIVTTPQDIALADARKGLRMFEKVAVPVLGIVENMSSHVCSKCGHEEHIFGTGGGARLAADAGVELLGDLPLDIRIREEADGGCPSVVSDPESARARAYFELARRTAIRLAHSARDYSRLFPKISVEDS